jgi:hypothetical protein
MTRKLYPLVATTVALSILFALGGIVWAGPVAPVCSAHPDRTCFAKGGDYFCSWTEDAP